MLLQLKVTRGLRVCAWDADVTEFDHGGSIMKSVSPLALVGRTISGFSFLFFLVGPLSSLTFFPTGLARHINHVCLSDSLMIFIFIILFLYAKHK